MCRWHSGGLLTFLFCISLFYAKTSLSTLKGSMTADLIYIKIYIDGKSNEKNTKLILRKTKHPEELVLPIPK